MPIFQFDVHDAPLGHTNYWGYAPVSFFAPHVPYSSKLDPQSAVREFRDMVKAFHRAGIEVILDVVFNHTAENDKAGPTFSFRGLDNRTYYILQPDRARYADYSGTGNTLNANHSVVRRLIVDSLRYWVEEMHVDGFRFDLASILGRDESGTPMLNPPVIWDIESEPELAGVKLIAEAWDAGGLYQVGSFAGDGWSEWNGHFRDDVRGFLRADRSSVRPFGNRLIGSPEIYTHAEGEVEPSVNFVTCHDGFTLNDVVSYNSKHNQANGEQNRDGTDDNRSWNSGVDGPSSDAAIEQLRNRQVKNFLAVTILSEGLPMILMGDEVRRTQQGNNNAYCQDNEVSWMDWRFATRHADVLRFVSLLNAHRSVDGAARGQWAFHGVHLGQPDWNPDSHSLALTWEDAVGYPLRHLIVNAYWEPLTFDLPPLAGALWRRWIDTSLDAPNEIVEPREAVTVKAGAYSAGPRSVVVLLAAHSDSDTAANSSSYKSTRTDL